MRRLTLVIGVVVCLVLALASVAKAGGPGPAIGPLSIGPLDPFQFGLGALATWARDAGKPGDFWDPDQYGLYLQKATPTSSYAAAGADIKVHNLPATKLTTLSFDISGVSGLAFDDYGGTTHGYCGAGAPRFNVVSGAANTCFLGCVHGDKTQDPATGWWTIKFVAPFTQYPGCDLTGISGNIGSISIILDEGTDVGPGNVVLDNIRVNNTVFKKP